LRFRIAAGKDDEAWERFVGAFPQAEFSHSFRMKTVYERVYGYRTAYWIGEEGGEIVGVCPLVYVQSLLHWNRTVLINLPMVTAAGLLAKDDTARSAFASHLDALSAAENAVIQLRGRVETALAGCATFRGYVTFSLPLRASTSSGYWEALSSRNRGKIRRSRKAGTTVRFGGRQLLDDFFALHVRRNTELATPPYPKAFFAALLDAFPHAEIALAENAGRPVAGMFNVGYKGVMNYLFGSSDSRFFDSYPNNQLFYEFIEHARAQGYDEIDFGRTPKGEGTYDFKKQWQADERDLFYQYLGNDADRFVGFSIQRVQKSFAFRLFSRVWSHYLPRRVIETLGPALIKRMPLA
jgi:CelD/BcsL family acetyltransferase involved in cellulose biosynthesis